MNCFQGLRRECRKYGDARKCVLGLRDLGPSHSSPPETPANCTTRTAGILFNARRSANVCHSQHPSTELVKTFQDCGEPRSIEGESYDTQRNDAVAFVTPPPGLPRSPCGQDSPLSRAGFIAGRGRPGRRQEPPPVSRPYGLFARKRSSRAFSRCSVMRAWAVIASRSVSALKMPRCCRL